VEAAQHEVYKYTGTLLTCYPFIIFLNSFLLTCLFVRIVFPFFLSLVPCWPVHAMVAYRNWHDLWADSLAFRCLPRTRGPLSKRRHKKLLKSTVSSSPEISGFRDKGLLGRISPFLILPRHSIRSAHWVSLTPFRNSVNLSNHAHPKLTH